MYFQNNFPMNFQVRRNDNKLSSYAPDTDPEGLDPPFDGSYQVNL